MDETETLRAELEHYKEEKEKIRDIVGRIGGRANRRQRLVINAVFLFLVLGAFLFELMRLAFRWNVPFMPRVLVLEVAVLLVSLKIIWMIHMQSKVDHFQFYVLHSIEFQMSMLSRRIGGLSAAIRSGSSGPENPGTKPPPSEKS
ncbi:MAG: hypothetical protein ACYTF6_01235 [Planctomycetota bacterium]|jgi:hypothetical protein